MSVRRVGSVVGALAVLLATVLGPALALPRVFLETQVSPRDPYLQAAVRVTVRLFSARSLYRAELDWPGNPNVVVHRIGTDWMSQVHRDGRNYQVLTRRYLLFGQRSGSLALPGPVLSAEVLAPAHAATPYTNPSGRSLRRYGYAAPGSIVPFELRGKTISLHVRPRPPGAAGAYWVPATHVTLSGALSHGPSPTRVGDALGLDLTVQAQGLTADALPDLTALLRPPPGLRAYPNAPKLENLARGDTLVGRREQSVALIAARPGRYTVPAVTLHWWDTTYNVERTASLPAHTIVVLPRAGAAVGGATAPPAHAATSPVALGRVDPWMWATLALALAWAVTLGTWTVVRRRSHSRTTPSGREAGAPPGAPPGASRSRAAFFDACRANDPRATRRHLLEWTAAAWPTPAPRGLNDLAKRLGEPQTVALLRELDRACYAGGAWKGEALAKQLATLPRPAHAAVDRQPIAPLYR